MGYKVTTRQSRSNFARICSLNRAKRRKPHITRISVISVFNFISVSVSIALTEMTGHFRFYFRFWPYFRFSFSFVSISVSISVFKPFWTRSRYTRIAEMCNFYHATPFVLLSVVNLIWIFNLIYLWNCAVLSFILLLSCSVRVQLLVMLLMFCLNYIRLTF